MRRKPVVNNITITIPDGVDPSDTGHQVAQSFQTMTDPFRKAQPVKPDPVVKPPIRQNPLRRRHYWVNVQKGEPLPRGRIIWAEPHGGGALEGGLRICVVRRG